MTDLCYLSAVEARALFQARVLSPVDVMQALLARADAVEGRINAFTFRYPERAMDAARAAEARFAKGARTRALEGLPVAIKDAGHIKGLPTSAGSLTSDDAPQPVSSPINDRVLRAGAICHARSATPEFSCAAVTHSRRWGVTRNPWNLAFTPGGSSGGAGAALAAGMTLLATGSDIAGSIRIPASCSGVVGYKPPKGRTPVDPPFNLDSFCHTGPMARTVADTILLQNAMAGPHPGDPTTLRPRLRLPYDPKPIRGWKIAWSMDLGCYAVDPEVAANTRAALDVFRDLGCQVSEIALPWGAEVPEAANTYLAHIFGTSIAPLLDRHADDLTPYARTFAQAGRDSPAADFFAALQVVARVGVSFAQAMRGYDLFVCPTTALPAVSADFDSTIARVTIGARPADPFLGWVMTVPFNMASAHPVLAVPSGRTRDDVPTGIQLVGQPYQDRAVFRAGLAYETAVGAWYRQAASRPTL